MQPNGTDDIRDIIEPTALVDPLYVALIAAIALAVLVLVLLITLVLIKKAKKSPPPPPRTPRADALAELERIRKDMAEIPPNEASTQIEDALKTYLFYAHQEPAQYLTTQELFGNRRPASRPPATPETLRFHRCFDLCDAIRFGRANEVTPQHAMDAAFTALTEDAAQPQPERPHAAG